MRDSFVFYSSFAQAANMLGDKARLKLYDAVVKLGLCCAENVTELEQVCNEIETSLAQNRNAFAQFLLIKPQIIANFTRYINGRKGKEYGRLGAEYGKLGGRPSKNDKNPPNVNVNVNVNENNKKEIVKEKVFKKPTLEEITTYCKERNNGVVAEKFFDFYESKGWKVGNQPMKDWRAAVRTWERSSASAPVTMEQVTFGGYQTEREQKEYEAAYRQAELTKQRLAERVMKRGV